MLLRLLHGQRVVLWKAKLLLKVNVGDPVDSKKVTAIADELSHIVDFDNGFSLLSMAAWDLTLLISLQQTTTASLHCYICLIAICSAWD